MHEYKFRNLDGLPFNFDLTISGESPASFTAEGQEKEAREAETSELHQINWLNNWLINFWKIIFYAIVTTVDIF